MYFACLLSVYEEPAITVYYTYELQNSIEYLQMPENLEYNLTII